MLSLPASVGIVLLRAGFTNALQIEQGAKKKKSHLVQFMIMHPEVFDCLQP
jgi:hypothetical protein